MTPSVLNTAIASALQTNAAIAAFCAATWGRGCLIQENENPGDPLDDEQAPWICCLVWPTAELGPIIDANSCEIVLSAGVVKPQAALTAVLPDLIQPRTASANGLQRYGQASEAEALLLLAIAAAKELDLDGAIIGASKVETDGWLHYPLQIASTVLSIREPNTL